MRKGMKNRLYNTGFVGDFDGQIIRQCIVGNLIFHHPWLNGGPWFQSQWPPSRPQETLWYPRLDRLVW